MSRVNHANFVNVLAFGEETTAHVFWAQLECCEGGDLEKRLGDEQIHERGGVDEPELFRWAHECIAGLEAIHKANVMHRDIKPANILLTVWEDTNAHCKVPPVCYPPLHGH